MEYTLGSIMNAVGITDLECTRAANIGDITLEDYFEIVEFKCRLVRSTALRIWMADIHLLGALQIYRIESWCSKIGCPSSLVGIR